MPNTVFLRHLKKLLGKKTNKEAASALRALAADFKDMNDNSTATIDHPHTSAVFFEDLAKRLDQLHESRC